MKKSIIALAIAGVSISTVAQADIRIDARQANQQRLIDAGKRSGKLSRVERDRLTAQQQNIKRIEARLERSGGRFTRAEKDQINAMLDRSERDIEKAKRDGVRGRGGIHM
jgi:hypothetical protein